MVGRVPVRHTQPVGIGCTVFLFQNNGYVRTPRHSRRARHFVKHVVVILLSDVVDGNECLSAKSLMREMARDRLHRH